MNDIRRLVGIVLALVMVAFAVPSFGAPQAQSKFSVSLVSNAALTLTATVTNLGGNSNMATISSFELTFTGAQIDLAGTSGQVGNGKVSLDGNSSVLVTKLTAIPQNGQYVLTIKLKDCGSNLTMTAQAWTGSQKTGNQFVWNEAPSLAVPNVTCGSVACNSAASQVIPSSSYVATVTRGTYDKDGITTSDAVCGSTYLSYTVSNLGANKRKFAWPVTGAGSDDAAAFKYTFASTVPLAHVAWLEHPVGTPIFVDGIACLPHPDGSPADLPAPYGSLLAGRAADGAASASTSAAVYLEVNPSGTVARAAPPTQFDLIGGTTGERLRVYFDPTAGPTTNGLGPLGGELWKVVARNVGGTPTVQQPGPFSATTLVVGDLMMYTALPQLASTFTSTATADQLAAGYTNDMQAQMCIFHQYTASEPYVIFGDFGDGVHQP
jgi:hypothetical protein